MEPGESADGIGRLASSIEALSEQVEVLRDAIDECRVDLAWAVQNGKAVIFAVPCAQCSTVKAMAADPLSDRWGQKLEIVRGRGVASECMEIERLTQTVESLSDSIAAVEIGIRWLHSQVTDATEKVPDAAANASADGLCPALPKHQRTLF